jgi:hypothetical protein
MESLLCVSQWCLATVSMTLSVARASTLHMSVSLVSPLQLVDGIRSSSTRAYLLSPQMLRIMLGCRRSGHSRVERLYGPTIPHLPAYNLITPHLPSVNVLVLGVDQEDNMYSTVKQRVLHAYTSGPQVRIPYCMRASP